MHTSRRQYFITIVSALLVFALWCQSAQAQISDKWMSTINSYLLLDADDLNPPPLPPVQKGVSWLEGDGRYGASRDRWHPFSNIDWTNFMGDYVDRFNIQEGSAPFATATATGQGDWLDLDVTSLVNQWLNNNIVNHGFRVQTFTTGIRASSREGVNPPQLVLDGQTHITQRDTTLSRSTYLASGFSDELSIQGSNGSVNRVALIYFSLPEQISSVNEATLRLYVERKFSGSHQLAVFATRIDTSLVPPVLGTAPLTESYASETELCGDADVLLCEQFEGSISGAWTGDRSDISYVSGYQGMSARNTIPTASHTGANLEYFFAEDQEEIFVRYYVRHAGSYATDLDGGKQAIGVSARYRNRSVPAGVTGCEDEAGDSAVGGWGGRRTDGCNGFSARGQWSVSSTDNVDQGTYLYHMDQESVFGEGMYTGPSPVNTWDCMEVQIKMNTRHPDALQRDGIFRSWRNNQLISSRFSRFTRLPYGIENVWWNVYHGGTTTAPRPVTFDFDNLVVSKKRIGCF